MLYMFIDIQHVLKVPKTFYTLPHFKHAFTLFTLLHLFSKYIDENMLEIENYIMSLIMTLLGRRTPSGFTGYRIPAFLS